MKNDCGGHSPLSDIQLPLTMTFYATLASHLFSIGINMGFAMYVSCCKNFHRAPLGISLLHAFMGRTSLSNYPGSTFSFCMKLVVLEVREERISDERPWVQCGLPAFREPSAELPRTFRAGIKFQLTYSNLSQYHYSYNAPSTVLIRWNHRGEESDQYSGRVSILGFRGLPLLQCPNPSVNPKCA